MKTFLEDLFVKLQDKAQDENTDIILSGVKKYGPELIGVEFRLSKEHMKVFIKLIL